MPPGIRSFKMEETIEQYRSKLKDKKRSVVKIGSSSLQHPQTGELDYIKLEVLVRELCNLRNQGKDVVLVTSGAIAQGRRAMHLSDEDFSQNRIAMKQACAAIGQARLMMTYERIFAEYSQVTAQILLTKNTVVDNLNRYNAHNTFTQLLKMGVIPVVNENDTVATYELELDNDTLSAIVAALIGADLLILLSDIDGLYTDDPRKNPDAKFVDLVEELNDSHRNMAKNSTGSSVGTGGMNTKLTAARIATRAGADMLIANSRDVRIIHRLMDGQNLGTLCVAHRDEDCDLPGFVSKLNQ